MATSFSCTYEENEQGKDQPQDQKEEREAPFPGKLSSPTPLIASGPPELQTLPGFRFKVSSSSLVGQAQLFSFFKGGAVNERRRQNVGQAGNVSPPHPTSSHTKQQHHRCVIFRA